MGCELVKNRSQFNKGFIKNYNKESKIGHFPEVDVQYPQKLHELHNDLPFLSEIMKVGKVENLQAICITKKNMLYT